MTTDEAVKRRFSLWPILLVTSIGIIILILNFNPVWHWVEVHTGTVDESGPYYGWWSGFGGFTTLALSGLGIAAHSLRKHNCHIHGCWRISRHQVEGTPYCVCSKHHPDTPDGKITPEHVARAYAGRRR